MVPKFKTDMNAVCEKPKAMIAISSMFNCFDVSDKSLKRSVRKKCLKVFSILFKVIFFYRKIGVNVFLYPHLKLYN
ncbi:hypothetical protein CBF29_02960 [Vagococcus elongatus]|uniref:Uncharacterized protein n=1 Tax=Vagococcus elongatus TaxID=180344 RepID=A0A430B1Q9_9ENTE|nr:hypothetical protein CBF29_02960 [Vagococcus elongatus]